VVFASTGAVTADKLVGLRSSGTWQKEQVSKAISLDACSFFVCGVGNITRTSCQGAWLETLRQFRRSSQTLQKRICLQNCIFFGTRTLFSAAAPSIFKILEFTKKYIHVILLG